jgi:NADH dehydrogenase FAD-containing subunit
LRRICRLRAQKRLEKLGVEVRLGLGVDKIDGEGVVVAGERIASKAVIWTAGVAPSPAGKWLGTETDKAGRVRVQGDLRVPGYPDIFVIGHGLTRAGREALTWCGPSSDPAGALRENLDFQACYWPKRT